MRFLLKALTRLPLPFLHRLGSLLGALVWSLDRRYSKRITENLILSGLSASVAPRDVAAEAGKALIDTLVAWLRTPEETFKLVQGCTGWAEVEAAQAAGKPLIFVTPHLGSYDIAGRYVSEALKVPLTALYREPKLKWLTPLMEAGRRRNKGHTAPANSQGVRLLLKALKRKEAIMILPDQVPGAGEGEWAPFFGQPAYTMTLLPRLIENSGAAVFFFYGERLDAGKGFWIHIEPFSTPFAETPSPVTQINQAVETLIQKSPTQYLWSYNRYKTPSGAKEKNHSP